MKMKVLLICAFIVLAALHPENGFSQVSIPFAFSSEEDNRLIKETDSFKYYVATGDTTKVVCIDDEGAYYKLLSKDGKVLTEGAFVMDGEKYLQQGRWTEHYASGKVKLQGSFLRSKPVGTWQEYYSNGKIKTLSNYALINDAQNSRKSCLSGSYEEYYQSGKLKVSGFYAAVATAKSDTIDVEDPVTGEKKSVITRSALYRPEKAGLWEHYDENGEIEKKEEL